VKQIDPTDKSFKWKASGEASGVYVLKVLVGERVFSKKLLLMK